MPNHTMPPQEITLFATGGLGFVLKKENKSDEKGYDTV